LPLSLTIGAWLLRDALGPSNGAVGYAVGPYSADRPDLFEWAADLETEVALLVVGDGSARRSTVAPGYFDERAEAFDAGVAAALRSGDAELLHLDVGLGDELLASGPPVWGEAANALEGSEFDDAELLYEDAPYGVGYFVAAWTNK
jgi:hypothetical protein